MWKIDVSDAKKGVVLNVDWNLYRITESSHTHTGRWGATYTLKAKNIITWANNTMTYKSGVTLESADVNMMLSTYLYTDGTNYNFMINDTWEMFELSDDIIWDYTDYLKENLSCYLMIYNENPIGIKLPDVITYRIVSTLPGDKWNRATAGKKPATIETGLEVQVPLFASEGDKVSVNTNTWEVV